MSDTARDYQTIDPASTEGLAKLFDTVQGNCVGVQDTVQDGRSGVQDTVQQEMSVVEAAQILNVDRRSVVRLLNWSKLSGRKDSRGKWFVDRQSVLRRLDALDSVQCEAVDVQDGVQPDESGVQDSVQPVESGVQDTTLQIIKDQAEQLKNAYHYLDAATARVLYLQQQLEQKDQEIKLLTDSQHKGGWWARFSSWFFGSW